MKYLPILVSTLMALSYMPQANSQDAEDTGASRGISFEDIQARNPDATGERFNQLDTDGNGLLTRQERNQGLRERAQQRFSETDLDGSGGLSQEEILARNPDASTERFSRLDRNGDGELGQREVRFGNQARQRAQRGGSNGPRPGNNANRTRGNRPQ